MYAYSSTDAYTSTTQRACYLSVYTVHIRHGTFSAPHAVLQPESSLREGHLEQSRAPRHSAIWPQEYCDGGEDRQSHPSPSGELGADARQPQTDHAAEYRWAACTGQTADGEEDSLIHGSDAYDAPVKLASRHSHGTRRDPGRRGLLWWSGDADAAEYPCRDGEEISHLMVVYALSLRCIFTWPART